MMTYSEVVALTQKIAREKGIMWEEEQAEIAYEVLRRQAGEE